MVSVPAVGRFQLVYKAAQIDYIQKRISPPGKFIEFIENDAITAQDLSTDQCPEIEHASWDNMGVNWLQRLNNKETILVPNIGSLYKDFRGQTHFLANGINFDDSYFGLQNLTIVPVIRKQTAAPIAAVPKPTVSIKTKTLRRSGQFADLAFSVLIGLTLIAISFGVWYAMGTKQIAKAPSKFEVAESTLEDQKKLEDILDYDAKWTQPGYYAEDSLANENDTLDEILPGDGTESETTNTENASVSDDTANNVIETKAEIAKAKPAVISQPTLANTGDCMISVGSFSSESNAKTLVKTLEKKGFTATIQSSAANMNRVVVMSACNKSDKIIMLDKLKKDVNPNAYFLK